MAIRGKLQQLAGRMTAVRGPAGRSLRAQCEPRCPLTMKRRERTAPIRFGEFGSPDVFGRLRPFVGGMGDAVQRHRTSHLLRM